MNKNKKLAVFETINKHFEKSAYLSVGAFGFDRVRVLYRKQRRELLRNIILGLFKGKALVKYSQTQAKILAKPEDLDNFLEDLKEDLENLGPERFVGIGVTEEELETWLKLSTPLSHTQVIVLTGSGQI